MEEILKIRNVPKAFKQVRANKGAGGIEGMQTDELRDYLNQNWQGLRASILESTYCPQPVQKVDIPKAGAEDTPMGDTYRNRPVDPTINSAMVEPPVCRGSFLPIAMDLERTAAPIKRYGRHKQS